MFIRAGFDPGFFSIISRCSSMFHRLNWCIFRCFWVYLTIARHVKAGFFDNPKFLFERDHKKTVPRQ
jgi:hypothetical protein